MTVTEQITKGIEAGRSIYESMTAVSAAGDEREEVSELCLGDNLTYMRSLLSRGYGGAFRLIYIDPPFFTRSSFNASISLKDEKGASHKIHHLAYDDKFDRDLEYYIENMTARLLMMKDLLSDEGLMWVHLDWHSSHYIKLVLDELMGQKNFVNEIIWQYKSGGSGKRHFARTHDTILVYSKSKNYYLDVPTEKSYNRDRKPYRFRGVAEYKDEGGWYTMVNMKDVWNIDMVGRTSAERTGYATQKPLELMKRIVESSTKEGELCGDFFCGSGSLPEAAHMLGRRWIACDSEELAASMARHRLRKAGADFAFIRQDTRIPCTGRADIKVLSTDRLEDGRTLYRCRLSDLLPDIDTGSIQMKDRRYVEDALRADRLQFAGHIMVDPDHSGSFNCAHVFDASEGEFSFISGGNFAVMVVDIFGREYLAEIS
ncbi:MAG: site-specific DNA-methyltransferase [Mogibacterium sp.]|nr:site-specific DNA-methyltransferase [Mogibacterium sp.]